MILVTHFLNTLFPERCVGCKNRGSLLCSNCAQKISPAQAPMHGWITSVFAYQDFRIKRLIWMLKYRNGKRTAKILAPYMQSALVEFLGEEQLFLGARNVSLVPVPLSKKRMARRGYNQAELLAKEILTLMPDSACVLHTDILKKEKETIAQADIKKRSDRLKNLGQCFSVVRKPETGKTVILIDDVTTTGATLFEARRALKEAGYRKVYALTVGH
jgi:ComF family protein